MSMPPAQQHQVEQHYKSVVRELQNVQAARHQFQQVARAAEVRFHLMIASETSCQRRGSQQLMRSTAWRYHWAALPALPAGRRCRRGGNPHHLVAQHT